jgi:hypothetical protein
MAVTLQRVLYQYNVAVSCEKVPFFLTSQGAIKRLLLSKKCYYLEEGIIVVGEVK